MFGDRFITKCSFDFAQIVNKPILSTYLFNIDQYKLPVTYFHVFFYLITDKALSCKPGTKLLVTCLLYRGLVRNFAMQSYIFQFDHSIWDRKSN